jgi:hypothetical protein
MSHQHSDRRTAPRQVSVTRASMSGLPCFDPLAFGPGRSPAADSTKRGEAEQAPAPSTGTPDIS